METFPGEIWGIVFGHLNVSEAIKTMSAFWYNADEIKAELEKRPGVFFWRGKTVESKAWRTKRVSLQPSHL